MSWHAEKWIAILTSACSAPQVEEMKLLEKAWQTCLSSNISPNVQTQKLVAYNWSSKEKPPRLLVNLQTLPFCSVIPELCQTHSIYFNELQLINSICSLNPSSPGSHINSKECAHTKSYPGHTYYFSKRKGMLRYCRWEPRWLSPSYLFRLFPLHSMVGNIT